jgi:hypothetical protein
MESAAAHTPETDKFADSKYDAVLSSMSPFIIRNSV